LQRPIAPPIEVGEKGEDAMAFGINVNGNTRSVDVDGDTPLLWVLCDVLGMTGTKFGCGMALCGACTVHIDGVATRSCVTFVDSIGKSEITTIEAIGATAAGAKILAKIRASKIPVPGFGIRQIALERLPSESDERGIVPPPGHRG
jgi:xanthine dehydrogenase iron-sulfur cluster and FAD-binding subunit A